MDSLVEWHNLNMVEGVPGLTLGPACLQLAPLWCRRRCPGLLSLAGRPGRRRRCQRGAIYKHACRTQGKPGNALNHVKVMPLAQGGHEHCAMIIQNILMIWDVHSNRITIIKYSFNKLTETQMLLNKTN